MSLNPSSQFLSQQTENTEIETSGSGTNTFTSYFGCSAKASGYGKGSLSRNSTGASCKIDVYYNIL